MSEWLKEQPWKGCVGLVLTAGSNPALSDGRQANREAELLFNCGLLLNCSPVQAFYEQDSNPRGCGGKIPQVVGVTAVSTARAACRWW